METWSQDPLALLDAIARLDATAPDRVDGAGLPLGNRRLPPELEIALDAGAAQRDVAAALAGAPAGVSPLQELLAAGAIQEEVYYQALARTIGCPYYFGAPRVAQNFDAVKSLRIGVALLSEPRDGARAVLAPRAEDARRLIDMTSAGLLDPKDFALTSPQRFAAIIRAQRSRDILGNALSRVPATLSARTGLTGTQIGVIGLAASLAIAVGAASWQTLSLIASAILWILFLVSIGLRALASVANPTEKAARPLSDDELPVYTVVAALYREGRVVRQLVGALSRLDYPASKLDIKLVVERRDDDTIERLLALDLPARFEIVVAPPGEPSTKPRALNLALAEARGEHLVVFDAEDIPDPGQIRLAASRFAADPHVDCLQARLTVRNLHDSWLARLYAVEYAALFDLINPGLCSLGLPIALGGTSNHFRVSALRDLGGWDEWNVAEDADLGVRLARRGYRVDALGSDTSEEAPYELRNWFWQRVRWQKGWMQTCIVHSRKPFGFVRDLKAVRSAAAAILIFGAVASALFWPVFAVCTLWRAFGPDAAAVSRWREAADLLIYFVALAGVWSLLIPAVVAVRQRRLPVGIGSFLCLPAYYVLVSCAAWTAIVDLVVRPHFWSKTEHGRAGGLRPQAQVQPRAPS